jgi:hypothetical protein
MQYRIGEEVEPLENPPHYRGWVNKEDWDLDFHGCFVDNTYIIESIGTDTILSEEIDMDGEYVSEVTFCKEQLEGFVLPPRSTLTPVVVQAGMISNEG